MKLKHYASRYINWGKSVNIIKDWKYNIIDKYLKDWDSVLDIWCASWEFHNTWKHKNINYFWIDYNTDLVEYCKSKGLDALEVNLSTDILPHENRSMNFVYCSHVLEHLSSNEQIRFFSEVSRVLKKWWVLILLTPTPYSWYFWDDPTHQRASTHGSLEHLSKDFWLEVIESKYSNLRLFSQGLQKWFRLPPLRWFMWEVYLIAKKAK